ncbi:hypothetical protein HAX54_034625, partial [Datura stramonium]|nr:hypothetical protein [Datura stramonium]
PTYRITLENDTEKMSQLASARYSQPPSPPSSCEKHKLNHFTEFEVMKILP